ANGSCETGWHWTGRNTPGDDMTRPSMTPNAPAAESGRAVTSSPGAIAPASAPTVGRPPALMTPTRIPETCNDAVLNDPNLASRRSNVVVRANDAISLRFREQVQIAAIAQSRHIADSFGSHRTPLVGAARDPVCQDETNLRLLGHVDPSIKARVF